MDRRQMKTRNAIFTAFEHLLSKKNYSKITVKDIIDEANVGRTTFYEHFETKDDLLQELCSSLFNHIFSDNEDEGTHQYSLSEGDSEKMITHILYHLRDGKKSMIKLLSGESSEIFLFYFKSYLNSMFLPYLLDEIKTENEKIPEDFLKNHISGSFLNMVQWWIKGGMKETPEKLAEYFLAVTEPIL